MLSYDSDQPGRICRRHDVARLRVLGSVARTDRETFDRDWVIQDAVIRELEVLGGATGRMSPGFVAANPSIPWQEMTGIRHKLIHDYFVVDLSIVWETAAWLLPVFVSYAPSGLADENAYYRLGLTQCVISQLTHDLGGLKGANVYSSTDDGSTWLLRGQAKRVETELELPGGDLIEHAVVERSDGSLWMLIRTAPGIGESVSRDGGRSSSPAKDSGIRHPLRRFFVRRLASGRLLMVRHERVSRPAER